MDPALIATLALRLLAMGAEAYDRHRAAGAALQAMLDENRPPTPEEWALLEAAGITESQRLEDLLGGD